MPAYAFTARSQAGKPVKGLRVAGTQAALALELAAEGLFLIRTEPVAGRRPGALKVSGKVLSAFLLHLATYLEAGIPLLTALRDFRDPERPALEAAAADMAARMAEGALLSEIMADHPGLFQPVQAAMVRAGEATGRLDQALRAVLRLVEWQDGLRAQVRKAAIYPLILVALLALIIIVVCAVSLPPILNLLEELQIDLPMVTRVFLLAGHGLMRFGWLLVALPAGLWYGLRLALRHPGPRLRWDTAVLALPAAGNLARRLALARFARFFAAQYRAGIPIVEALRNSEEVTGNARVGRSIRAIRLGVEEGGTLAGCAARSGQFPPLVLRMLAIGEESGKLDETLERVAVQFDAEVAEGVALFFQALDPVLRILMAGLLVFVATAVLLPLYTLVGGIND